MRLVREVRYRVVVEARQNKEAIEKLREEAGCFVLLANVPAEEKNGIDILKTYKEQDGIERNFGFLKDPLVANDVFLKKPRRIEAMGLVLVLSLLLWRLMERTMRRKTTDEHIMLKGWNNADTLRPTSFMMASKFSPVFVGLRDDKRFLFAPLTTVQLAYLTALDVHPAIFTEMASKAGVGAQETALVSSHQRAFKSGQLVDLTHTEGGVAFTFFIRRLEEEHQ
ncbi:MAG: hypothetical protein ABSD38_24570 [Syntrophorhabdales bacterium]